MYVELSGQSGTIGGGRLEFDAIAHAQKMLQTGEKADTKTIQLGPSIGQCCGGQVELEFQEIKGLPDPTTGNGQVYIFGGGHVGKALARAFAPLPVQLSLVETRRDYLDDLPGSVEGIELAAPEAAVRGARENAAFVVTTHDHALDFLIVEEALMRGDAAYVGMIGSKTKRAVLGKRLKDNGVDPTPLVCPIGGAGLGDKRPEVIAAFVVPEILIALGIPK